MANKIKTEVEKDCAELCDIAKYFDQRGGKSNGDFLRGVAAKYKMADTFNALLQGEREHISSVDCWCAPYQDDQCPDVWIHNEMLTGRA